MKSGVSGIDELTKGGFPKGTITLLSGPPGSAKSLLGMQYIINGATQYDEKGLFIALEESRENILRAAGSYDMDIEKLEDAGMMQLIDFGDVRKETTTDDELALGIVNFRNLQDILIRIIKESGASRLVIDSIPAVGIYYSSTDELRRELFIFCRNLKDTGITTLMITEAVKDRETRFHMEEFVVDAILDLGYENVEGEYRRTLTIYKMRFTKHDPYKHPFLITGKGIEVDHVEIIY